MDKQQKKKKGKKSEEKDNRSNKELSRYSSIVIKMTAVILAGIFGGQWADEKLNLEFPLFTLLLSLIAVALAIYIIIRDTK